MYGRLFGGQMNADMQRQFVQGQAMENLINSELVSQAVTDQGILVTDAEVRDFILNDMQVFQKEGKFNKDLYTGILQANHLNPVDFEEKIRKDRKNMRIHQLFTAASVPANLELLKLKALKAQKTNVSFAKIDEEALVNSMKISDQDIQGKLANADFMKKVETDFNLSKAQYSTEEQVRASHILIKANPSDSASEKKALEKIQGLQKRAAKEDFGKLAAEFSDDTGSKVKKGDLGFFGKGRMVPEFDKVAFESEVGKISEPVKSQFGYHLIKVTEKKPAFVATLENSKVKVAKKLIVQEKVQAISKDIEAALQTGDSAKVDSMVKGLGVNWEETGFFDLNTESVPKLTSKLASNAAFEVSEAKPLLKRIVQDGSSKFIIRFKAAKKEEASAEDKNSLAQLSQERAGESFNHWIEQVKKTATIEKNNQVLRAE
jgi:peptidyl-prolyl cis-trans isomerase D